MSKLLYTIKFQNISIAIVGKDEPFHILNEDENSQYLTKIVRKGGGGSAQAESGIAPRPDDDQPPQDPIPIVAMETQD